MPTVTNFVIKSKIDKRNESIVYGYVDKFHSTLNGKKKTLNDTNNICKNWTVLITIRI